MNKIFFLFLIALFTSTYATAQHYKTAAGIRLGGGVGLTVQQYIGEKTTIEGIVSTKQDGDTYDISVLLEKHINLMTRRVNFYYGVGPQVGILKDKKPNFQNTFGVSGMAGMEFTMRHWSFSVDYKPTWNLSKGTEQDGFYGGLALSARYIIVEREKFTERIKKRFKRKT